MTTWISAKHNMGMAFTRTLWDKLRACRAQFCGFDDYNWDWSLLHVSLKCFQERANVMLVKAPRVFHVGEWYVHRTQAVLALLHTLLFQRGTSYEEGL